MADEVCSTCGQLIGIEDYDNRLWDIYHRIPDRRNTIEAMVFTSDDYYEYDDMDEAHEIINHVMEKNMYERGLCTNCGRPNLSMFDLSDLMSEEDAKDYWEMAAEQAAERRAGC